jgi:hypothetical protein
MRLTCQSSRGKHRPAWPFFYLSLGVVKSEPIGLLDENVDRQNLY